MTTVNIIDIEASGLHFDSYPIEVAVLVEGVFKSWLIKPELNWTFWDSSAERMHGISREQLNERGQPAWEVVRELEQFISGSNGLLYSDAAPWDSDWVDTLYFAANRSRQFHITSIYDLFDDRQTERFNSVKEQLILSGKYRQHRAEEDVKLISDSYLITLNN